VLLLCGRAGGRCGKSYSTIFSKAMNQADLESEVPFVVRNWRGKSSPSPSI